MKTGLSIHEVVLENENAWRPEVETRAGLLRIFGVMRDCIFTGCHSTGVLPGGLNVKRRAESLNTRLLKGHAYSDFEGWKKVIREGGNHFKYTLDWVSCFALAVNEQNASLGRVVTAPTNGAGGRNTGGGSGIISFFVTAIVRKRSCLFYSQPLRSGVFLKKELLFPLLWGDARAEIGVSSAMAAVL